MTESDHKRLVKSAALDERAFLRLTLSQPRGADAAPWVKISVRPVRVRGQRVMQFSYFDPQKDTTKNFAGDEAEKRLDEALAMPFGQIHVQTTAGDLHVRITRKGKALVKKGKPSRQNAPALAHDHVKQYPLAVGQPDAFLQALGIMNAQSKVRAAMQAKFRQINEFLRIVEQTVLGECRVTGDECRETESAVACAPFPVTRHPPPVTQIIDCGCGSAYLSFAAYHYLNHVRGVATRLTGVDRNAELIGKCC
ncbi:MAG: methyltransferase, partial [Planctomycetes bacterium]|nr:methyltransferase [Planctomycetota bacterium]